MGPLLHPSCCFLITGGWFEVRNLPLLRPSKLLPPSDSTSSCSLALVWMKSIILVMVLLPYEPEGNEGRGETQGEAGVRGSTIKMGLHWFILAKPIPVTSGKAEIPPVGSLTSQEMLETKVVKAKPIPAHHCWGMEEEEAAAASSAEHSSEMHHSACGAEDFNPISHTVFFVVTTASDFNSLPRVFSTEPLPWKAGSGPR